jgi:hypothetical protein
MHRRLKKNVYAIALNPSVYRIIKKFGLANRGTA